MTRLKYFIFFSSFCFNLIFSQIQWQFEKDSLITWYYQEGDEFNGDTLNRSYWSTWYGWARSISSNKEQQYYTDKGNHFLKDGKLYLTAKKEKIKKRYVDWQNDNDSIFNGDKFDGFNLREFNYSAGLIQAHNDFLYGYFEIKFKNPYQKGFWPAFWLYGGTPNEEIDWMELKSERDNQVHVGRHCQYKKDNVFRTLFGKKYWGRWVKFEGSLKEGYNVISGIWTKDKLKYYLNGECIAIAKTTMSIPKKLVANIAVSSNNGSFPPAPDDNFKDSAVFEIDYIRVWNRYKQSPRRLNLLNIQSDENIAGATEIAKSKLITKDKLHYGKKTNHKNEGFFASMMPEKNQKYQLTILGKEIPADGQVFLYTSDKNILYQSSLKYGITTFDLQKYLNENLELKIIAFGKTAEYTFTVY
ncbi:MAG: family 16 glycosylhydrolase [Bacteroidia bacterium]